VRDDPLCLTLVALYPGQLSNETAAAIEGTASIKVARRDDNEILLPDILQRRWMKTKGMKTALR